MRGRKLCIGSAGVAARVGNPAAGHACALMSELGIEIGDHRARQLTRALARDYTFRDEAAVLALYPDPQEAYVKKIMPEKIRINLAYAQRRSVATDLGILMQTLRSLWTQEAGRRRSHS